MNFEAALYNQLQAMTTWTPGLARLATQIATHPFGTPQVVAHLELLARANLDVNPTEPIDWTPGAPVSRPGVHTATTINWSAIIALIEQYLPTLFSIIEDIISAL